MADHQRQDVIARAQAHSPFLRDAIERLPMIVSTFAGRGAEAAWRLANEEEGDGVGATLRRQRRGVALATALGDLAGEYNLEALTARLSDFADGAIDAALTEAVREKIGKDAPNRGLAVLALGKLGSRELNYSSDVDLILLFDAETLPRRARDEPGEAAVRIARRMIELLQQRTADGYVARVDLRLRPSPEATPIVLPVGAAIGYYESEALPWERAAFIRARAAAGDRALGQSFLDEIRPFVWRRALDFGAIEDIRAISHRIRDHYSQGSAFGPGFDLKRGRGGIREAEFFAQVQQLIHGGRRPEVRAPATLDAYAALKAEGLVDPDLADTLANAYRALRTAEHRVQMIDDRQEHCLPTSAEGLEAVAGLDGIMPDAMLAAIAPHVTATAAAFDTLIAERGERLSTDPARLEEELAGLGMDNAGDAARHIADWRSGRARSLRSPAALAAFEAMLPGLMRAIAGSADEGNALNRFADIVDRLSSGVNLFRLLEARPQLATLLALILSHAPPLADQLGRHPALLDALVDESIFALPRDAAELATMFEEQIGALSIDEALDRMRRLIGERKFALGVQLIAGHRDPIRIAEGYSDLAEASVVALTRRVTSEFEQAYGRIDGAALAVIALGRLGGHALTNASDLDLIFLFDAPDEVVSDGGKPLGATDYFNRLASRIGAALSVPTASGPMYEVDTRLRPQGAQGMLAVSLDAFERYQREQAWTWEHMALCRARPIAGDDALQARAAAMIEAILAAPRDGAKVRADAVAMRDDMARHKPAASDLDVKLGAGGLVDLEFAVHTLQLTTGIGLDPRLEVAIEALVEEAKLDDDTDEDLRLLSRFLVVLRLVSPRAGEVSEASRTLVASLCGADDWDELVTEMDEARGRIAARWQRVKEDA